MHDLYSRERIDEKADIWVRTIASFPLPLSLGTLLTCHTSRSRRIDHYLACPRLGILAAKLSPWSEHCICYAIYELHVLPAFQKSSALPGQALGVLLYYLCYTKLPFSGDNKLEVSAFCPLTDVVG